MNRKEYMTNSYRKSFEQLGNTQKELEGREAGRKIMPGVPVIGRLDGRAFHTYTRGLKRPFDESIQTCMRETMLAVIDEYDADIGFTQSDEITLVWFNQDTEFQFPFSGKIQKLVSVIPAYASVTFARKADVLLPGKAKRVPTFDCRLWQVGSIEYVIENLLWRQDDATRNSISMAGQAHFSQSYLHGVSTPRILELLQNEGIRWEDYNPHFKRGLFARRFTYEKTLDAATLAKIRADHRPTGPVTRSDVMAFDLQPIRKVPYEDLINWFMTPRVGMTDVDFITVIK